MLSEAVEMQLPQVLRGELEESQASKLRAEMDGWRAEFEGVMQTDGTCWQALKMELRAMQAEMSLKIVDETSVEVHEVDSAYEVPKDDSFDKDQSTGEVVKLTDEEVDEMIREAGCEGYDHLNNVDFVGYECAEATKVNLDAKFSLERVTVNLVGRKKKVKKKKELQKCPQLRAVVAAVLIVLSLAGMAIGTCAKAPAAETVKNEYLENLDKESTAQMAPSTTAKPSTATTMATGTLDVDMSKFVEYEEMAKPPAATTMAAGTRATKIEKRAPGTTEKPFAATTMAPGTNAKEEAGAEYTVAFKENDRDGNGFISAKEIRLTMRTRFTEEELFEAFGSFDHDGNGFISDAELSKVTKAMVRVADIDGDGLINFAEFVKNQGGDLGVM